MRFIRGIRGRSYFSSLSSKTSGMERGGCAATGFEAGGVAGALRGTVLAQAYADMDVLVFPSHTDTFGNVVLEALASGVPAVVTLDGGRSLWCGMGRRDL
jgi:glycosyltransferase involved in cell wall biosynthesis